MCLHVIQKQRKLWRINKDLFGLIRTGPHDSLCPGAEGSFCHTFFCSCSGLIVFFYVLFKSITQLLTLSHTHTHAPTHKGELMWSSCSPVDSDAIFAKAWTFLQTLRPKLRVAAFCKVLPFLHLLSVFFIISFLLCSILWRDDKKCHLRSHCLPWFPWQLQ